MKRKFVSCVPIRIVDNTGRGYISAHAVADDGTAWELAYSDDKGWRWVRLLPLPESED